MFVVACGEKKCCLSDFEYLNILNFLFFLSELLYDRCKWALFQLFELYQIEADVIPNNIVVMGMI
jgi:hypothetical protein